MKKSTKILLGVFVALVLVIIGIASIASSSDSSAKNVTSSDYKIFEEKLDDSNQQHLKVETELTDEKSLDAIVQKIYDSGDYKDADSVYIYLTTPSDENTDGDDDYEKPTMQARFANTEKGLVQTGLEELETFNSKYLYGKD